MPGPRETKTKTKTCPSCGGTTHLERRYDILTYQGHEKRIRLLGWWCALCGEATFDGPELARAEKAFVELKAEVDEVLTPRQVAEIREKLGLSQREASELLGGGPRSFQKYESGKVAVSVPMSNLLRLLSADPARIEELRLLRTSRQPGRIRSGARSKLDSRSIRGETARKAAGD
ncbi:MAG: type II toxin-antitoxin system MqsA family antitoxin [Polyangia bacterium]|jgi:HTH-type transcriptional regulator/antitoxin MqsA|nr:type II toxin-antitoxin system MqsA family antitoxin [Polyangia bacterium]